jgi:hypothetical protein
MHTRGEGAPHVPLQKTLKKCNNAIKYENRGPPTRFSHNPNYPLSKEFENDCASMSYEK